MSDLTPKPLADMLDDDTLTDPAALTDARYRAAFRTHYPLAAVRVHQPGADTPAESRARHSVPEGSVLLVTLTTASGSVYTLWATHEAVMLVRTSDAPILLGLRAEPQTVGLMRDRVLVAWLDDRLQYVADNDGRTSGCSTPVEDVVVHHPLAYLALRGLDSRTPRARN